MRSIYPLSIYCENLYELIRYVNFNALVYDDYVRELGHIQGITIRDFFDKDYVHRLYNIIRERKVLCRKEIEDNYTKVAQELSWIDREENGYFIIVPKTIPDFRYEGDIQHNCVYGCGYFERVIKRQSIIVFLREKKDIPFVTIEFDYETFDVLQALGKYNQKLDCTLYQYIVDLGKRLRAEMFSEQ